MATTPTTPAGTDVEVTASYQRRDNGDQVFTFAAGGLHFVVFAYPAPHTPQVFTFTSEAEAQKHYGMAAGYMSEWEGQGRNL